MKKYYGNYLGLVVENEDPEFRNRIKIFIPAISATILSKLNAKKQNVTIAGAGINLPNSLDPDTFDELKKILPWSECAAPLFGGGTSMHYNPASRRATNTNSIAAPKPGDPEFIGPVAPISSLVTPGDYHNAPGSGQKDAFSGAPDAAAPAAPAGTDQSAYNMLKYVTSIGMRETNFSQREAYSDQYNQSANNTNVAAKGAALGADYGFYQVNGENNKEAAAAGIGSLNGYEVNTSAAEQTKNISLYIEQVLSKRKGKTYGVAEVIKSGNFAQANQMLNGIWPSLPGGKSYRPGNEHGAQLALAGDSKVLSYAQDTTAIDKTNLKDNTTAVTRQVAASLGKKLNESTYDITGTYTTAMPGGMFSTPEINSHVWVFFNGGDPQYPVYFAQHIVIADWQRVNQVSSPPAKAKSATATSADSVSTISHPRAGMIEFIKNQTINDDGIQEDNCGIKITSTGGGVFSMRTYGNVEHAPVNKTVKVAGDYFLTVEKDHQVAIKGNNSYYIDEDCTTIIGSVSDDSIKAAKNIREILRTGHDVTVQASKEPSNKKVPCPVCNRKVISDKGSLASKLLDRAGNALLNLIGRDSIASRHVKEALKVATTPLKETTVKKIIKESSCGSPNCVNNMIPDYNAHSAEIDQQMIDYQDSVLETVAENELKLGIGGNQTTIIAKNSLTKVGLITNDLEPIVKQEDAFPIVNGINFVAKNGMAPAGDAVNTFKILDVPGPPIGFYEMFVGSRYNLRVGARGIHIETTGTIEIDGGHFELTSNYISLGNENGITKINGAAVIIEAKKSITLGQSPTNIHANGSLHASANITAGGSVFANGKVYAKELVMPCSVQRTDTASANPDYTTGAAIYTPSATLSLAKSKISKQLKHYNPVLHGMYPATGAGMSDILVDWLTQAQLSNWADNWSAPTGVAYGIGVSTVFTWPHIHMTHNMAHEHSYKGPAGQYVNDADEMYEQASLAGTPIPDI